VDPLTFGVFTNFVSDVLKAAFGAARKTFGAPEQRAYANVVRRAVKDVLTGLHGRLGERSVEAVETFLNFLAADPPASDMVVQAAWSHGPLNLHSLQTRCEELGLDPATLPIGFADLAARLQASVVDQLAREAGETDSPLFRRMVVSHIQAAAVGATGARPDEQPREETPDEDVFRRRLQPLPPHLAGQLTAAYHDDPRPMWRVVAALTGDDITPADVFVRWELGLPPFLACASWQTLAAAGELAAAYQQGRVAARLLTAAVQRGAVRPDFWTARAAVLTWSAGDRAAARALLGEPTVGPGIGDPYAVAVAKWFAGDRPGAEQDARRWTPSEPGEVALRALLLAYLTDPDVVDGGRRDVVEWTLHTLGEAWQRSGSPEVATMRAAWLGIRHGHVGTSRWHPDLIEARDAALQARDAYRRCRGDAADAVALACRAALTMRDWTGVLELGTVGEAGATPEEAASGQVSGCMTVAAIGLGNLELAASCVSRVTSRSTRALLHGWLAQAHGSDPQPHIRMAVETADGDGELLEALAAHAQTGSGELPRLAELATRLPTQAAEIEASAALAHGRTGDAIRLLRPLQHRLSAALKLASAYEAAGDQDRVVQTLTEASDRFDDHDLGVKVAALLLDQEHHDAAIDRLRTVLITASRDGQARRDALRMLAKLAVDAGRYEDAIGYLHTVVQDTPVDHQSRWELIHVFCSRGNRTAARMVLQDAPSTFTPTCEQDAQLWILLQRDLLPPEPWARACLAQLDRFGASAGFKDQVLAALVEADNEHPFSPPLRARLTDESQVLLAQWADAPDNSAPDLRDPDAVAAWLTRCTDATAEKADRIREIMHAVRRGEAPLEILAQVADVPLAELAIARGAGVLRIRVDEHAEIDACADAVRRAAGGDVVADTNALLTIAVLGDQLSLRLRGQFGRIFSTDHTLKDAHAARDVLRIRRVGWLGYDLDARALQWQQLDPDEVDRSIREADRLISTAESLHLRPRPASTLDPDLDVLPLSAACLRLAHARRAVLWSDDPAVRKVARRYGVPAMSTTAILDHLHACGDLDAADYESALRILIAARIGDMPFDRARLLALAEQDQWTAGPIGWVLSQHATWRHPEQALGLFRDIIQRASRHAPDTVADWLSFAVLAADHAHTREAAGRHTDMVFGLAVDALAVGDERLARLVEAARSALQESGLEAPEDPLGGCARLLCDFYQQTLSPADAASLVLMIFASLPGEDRAQVAAAVLQTGSQRWDALIT
jgi:hypothetical protein